MSNDKPRRLGRGLEALIATRAVSNAPTATHAESELQRVRIAEIRPNPYQPRKEFSPEELAELEQSIRSSGLLQPITVRHASGGGYELIAGERRLRAASRIGWTEIPAVVRDLDDRTMLTLAMVENLQRSDLNPIEEADGYRRLLDEFGLTQQQVAEVVGKDRSTIANALRLLQLPADVRRLLERGQLTAGHGRALLALADQKQMTAVAQDIVANGLSVREVEQRARDIATPAVEHRRERETPVARTNPEARRIQDDLRRRFQTDVALRVTDARKGKGRIEITFYSHDDLERILELVLGRDGARP